jgi:hypothetical protein
MNALDTPILVTFFRSYSAQNKGEALYTSREFAERIRTATGDTKGDLPWLKLARFGNRRSPPGPDGKGGNSLRWDANVLAISGIEADYDGEQIAVDEALETLEKQGIASLLYTSPSHTEDTPRWRVLCPLSEETKPAQRRHFLGRLNGLFRGILSRESWALSQSYYFGCVRNNPSHRVELIDGTPIDLHDDLDECWIGPGNNTDTAGNPADVTGDERETAELIRRIVTGEEYHTALTPLAARLIGRNAPRDITREILRGAMLAIPEDRHDGRWKARFDEIERLIDGAVTKYADPAEKRRNNNRTIARLASNMIRNRRHPDDIRAAVSAEADKIGMPRVEAIRVMDWVANQELDRRRAAYAAQNREATHASN